MLHHEQPSNVISFKESTLQQDLADQWTLVHTEVWFCLPFMFAIGRWSPYRRVNEYRRRAKCFCFKLKMMKTKAAKKKAPAGLPLVRSNAAGIDIGDTFHTVAVPEGRDEVQVRTFGAMTCDLLAIAQWLG
ncbi:MAG: hypothetical protein EOO10_21300, partial [Chitinophagaceae bacterium]